MKTKLFTGKWERPIGVVKNSKTDIGQRLRYFRKTRFNKAVELADELSISQGSLSELENGNSLPSASTLQNLYHAGCCINWLLTGEEE